METQTAAGLGEKRPVFPGNFGGKASYVSLPGLRRLRICEGGRIYQNRGVFVLLISNISIVFQKLITLPLIKLINHSHAH